MRTEVGLRIFVWEFVVAQATGGGDANWRKNVRCATMAIQEMAIQEMTIHESGSDG
jgi:hypothetical protein